MNATVEQQMAKPVKLNDTRMRKAIEEAESYTPKTRKISDDINDVVKQWNGTVINWTVQTKS